MNVRLIKLTKEYYPQLSEMIDEWKLDHEMNNANRSPWAIFKNDYRDFNYYLENLEITVPSGISMLSNLAQVQNARSPMLLMPLPNFTFLRLTQ